MCISKAIRRRKNGKGLTAFTTTNTTHTPGMMKKYLALALIAPLLVSCSSSNKKGAGYDEAWVKDTNGFDILMGQFRPQRRKYLGL
ncbi:murein transglycosylase C [Raoultella terrigena]|nr:murein transglycosylase C [Raoultella terrigena]